MRQFHFFFQALRFIRTAEIKPYVIFIKSPPFTDLQSTRQKQNAVFVYEGNARPFTVRIIYLSFMRTIAFMVDSAVT